MKILIIEDEKELAEGIKGILSKSGYESDAVYDGDTGLEYMLDRRYDLILLDLMLPGMDGLEILKTARMEGFSAPVIILTAKSQIEDKITGLDNGADDYLVKPFDAGELLARIRARTRNSLGGTGSVLLLITVYLSRYVTEPARKALEREKQFVTDASHELKTPLGAISANAQALEMNEGNIAYINNIISETSRMNRLIERLLTLSRIEEEVVPKRELFSLSEVLEEETLTYERRCL